MQFQKKEKRQTTVRFDSHHVRLRTGEVQRKTGSYMYRWTDKLGKRNTIYAATLEDLREQEEQILVDQHDGIKANIKNVTVNDVYELWCQLKRGIKDSTMKNYIYMYELFVKPTFGKKKLVQVKKSDVRRFYNQLIDDKVLKPSTVDVIHNIVHQVFQIAVDDDMIRSNPAANMLREIKMAHGSEIEKRKALTLEQEELFLGYLARTSKYQHWYPVFYIMANTGMRVGEITGLRWCDVDMENGIISVNHTLVYYNHRDEKGCYFSINTPKTKAGIREIPMTEGVKQAFLMEKEFQEECGMKSVSHIEGYSDFVFVNRNGEVQHQGTLNKALQRIMRDCNSEVLEKKGVDSDPALLPKFSCHVLRHTFATRMCESGLNVKVVQSVLGHADVTTTLDIYVTVTNDLKKREITAFETYLKTGAKQMAYDTALQLTGFDPVMASIRHYDFADAAKDTPFYKEIIQAMLDYFETEHYVFTHGWIPSIPNRDKSYSYISSWREADREQWNQARWFNGMDAAQTADENKTIVCGHWHTSYGHSKYEHKGTEFGEDADFSPYYGPGIIAIDACTAFSGKVNCLVMED